MAEKYVRGRTLGEGTWGQVYMATRREDGLAVAIKRMKGKDQLQVGLDFTALREIKYLQELKCEYIVNVSDSLRCYRSLIIHSMFIKIALKAYD
jgi:cyclin-dependent kinase 7